MIPSLAIIFDSCASMTVTALAAKTLPNKYRETKSIDERITHEIEIQAWLHRQILEYVPSAEEGIVETRKPKLLQQDLVDATLRQQQEELLLKRIRLAQFWPKNDTQMQCLIEEGLKAVLEQERVLMKKRQVLASLQSQIHTAEEERLRLQTENQEQWNVLQTEKTDKSRNKEDPDTQILKRVLQDITVGAGLDLSASKRLRQTLIRCEQ